MKKRNKFVKDEEGRYETREPMTRDELVDLAVSIIHRDMRRRDVLQSPGDVKAYLRLKLAECEREAFAVLFLDNRHRLIAYRELFYGTLDGSSVHPREVVKAALAHNAAAVILAHNHPSGTPEPSTPDKRITERLKDALALVEVRTLDHIVVGTEGAVSFAERGWL